MTLVYLPTGVKVEAAREQATALIATGAYKVFKETSRKAASKEQ